MTPYVGGGVGGARVAVDGANSVQIDPPEAGINHFNSGPDSSAWTFAAQFKAGARVALGSDAYVFGEYRYLFVGSTDQIFGPTVYPTHAPTSGVDGSLQRHATTWEPPASGLDSSLLVRRARRMLC